MSYHYPHQDILYNNKNTYIYFIYRGHQSSIVVIREVYESENAYEVFEVELERALDAGYHTIIIEPTRLGDETGRWISVGNCLHKTAVLSGLGAIGFGL